MADDNSYTDNDNSKNSKNSNSNNNNEDDDDDDHNNNNNNSNEQGAAAAAAADDPDFQYHFNYSTYCIFYQTPTSHSTFRWVNHPYYYPSFPTINTTIFSSALGLLLCHTHSPTTSTSIYYVGNPFANLPYIRLRPLLAHHSDTQAVLIPKRFDGDFHIISLLPNPTQEGYINYTIEHYSSSPTYWMILANRTHLYNDVGRFVIPNSGISCRRYGYWLTSSVSTSRFKVLVLRVDIKFSVNPLAYELMTYSTIPGQWEDVMTGMKLGRVGNKVGLVIVNETQSRVELHLMIERGSLDGNEDDDNARMDGWLPFQVLNVDVDTTVDDVVVEMEPLPPRIRCREMPKPLSFESYKMEVLLLVGNRMVVWTNSQTNRGRAIVKVMDGEVSTNGMQYLPVNGVTHVATSTVPRVQDNQ